MAIRNLVTRGFGNGSFDSTIPFVVTAGYSLPSITINLTGIPSSEDFGTISIIQEQIINMIGIPSSESFGKITLLGDAIIKGKAIISTIINKIITGIMK